MATVKLSPTAYSNSISYYLSTFGDDTPAVPFSFNGRPYVMVGYGGRNKKVYTGSAFVKATRSARRSSMPEDGFEKALYGKQLQTKTVLDAAPTVTESGVKYKLLTTPDLAFPGASKRSSWGVPRSMRANPTRKTRVKRAAKKTGKQVKRAAKKVAGAAKGAVRGAVKGARQNPVTEAERRRLRKSSFALPGMKKYAINSPGRAKYSLTLLNQHYEKGSRTRAEYVEAYVNICVAFLKNGQVSKRAPLVKTPMTLAAYKATSRLPNPSARASYATWLKSLGTLAKGCEAMAKKGKMTSERCEFVQRTYEKQSKIARSSNPTAGAPKNRTTLRKGDVLMPRSKPGIRFHPNLAVRVVESRSGTVRYEPLHPEWHRRTVGRGKPRATTRKSFITSFRKVSESDVESFRKDAASAAKEFLQFAKQDTARGYKESAAVHRTIAEDIMRTYGKSNPAKKATRKRTAKKPASPRKVAKKRTVKKSTKTKYGEVVRRKLKNVTVVVRKIYRARGDEYHVRVLKGAGLPANETKAGNVLFKADRKTKKTALNAARTWLKSSTGKAKIAKSLGKAAPKKATKKRTAKKRVAKKTTKRVKTTRRVAKKTSKKSTKAKYGQVFRRRLKNVTVVVRKIYRARGDEYHVRVLKGAGLPANETKAGNVLFKADRKTKAGAIGAARTWLKSSAGKAKIAKSIGKAAPKKGASKTATKKRTRKTATTKNVVRRKKYYVVWNARPAKYRVGTYSARVQQPARKTSRGVSTRGKILSGPTASQKKGFKNLQVFNTKREAESFVKKFKRKSNPASASDKIVASSFERYNGGVKVKRKWGSSTVTRFYVYKQKDKGDANKWKIVEAYGKTPGERKTYAINVFKKGGGKPAVRGSNPSKDVLHITTRNKKYYVLLGRDWVQVNSRFAKAALKGEAVKVPWSHGKLPHHKTTDMVDDRRLGWMMHNYHAGQNDPIYATGSVLVAGKRVSQAQLARALDAVRSLRSRDSMKRDRQLLVVERNLEERVGIRKARGAAKAGRKSNPKRKCNGCGKKENPTHKVRAKKIELHRVDGEEDKFRATSPNAWVKANQALARWARTAPTDDGEYDRVRYKVTYEDGEVYNGKYDLTRLDVTGADLGGRLRDYGMAILGRRDPGMGAAAYKKWCKSLKVDRKAWAKFLKTHEIG